MAHSIQQNRRVEVLTSASRVGLAYLVAGVLWILLSDTLLAAAVRDPELVSRLQTFKGWAFVGASAGLIWWLVRREVRRVQRSESRLDALAEQSIAGTYLIREGRFVQVNTRLAEIFGYTPDRLVGMRASELVAEKDRERIAQSLRNRRDGGVEFAHSRFTGLRADGTTVDLEVFGRWIEWDGSDAVTGLLLDVSERALLEEKLRQAARLDALGSLTGTVAHDFNNFLTGIIGNLDLMLSDPEGGSRELRTNLELVRDSAARAAALTGQLLTFGRGRIFHHRPIDANRHLRQLSSFLDSLCQGTQTLVLDLQDPLPPVMLDPVALDQLVMNLFVNAKDAVGNRGTITIRTYASRPSGGLPEVTLEVVDDGVGMPQDVLDRVFEPFFTTKERGTGLGLATVRSIVDEVRGHLTVESKTAVGTTIRVSLPATEEAFAETPASVPRAVTTSPKKVMAATILVVDDDASVRKVVAAALKRVGHHALVAATGAEAQRTLDGVQGSIDLLICDVNLGDVSGPELVTRVRTRHPELRVLFISGSHLSDIPEHVELLRASPFLEKPFSLEKLRDAVAYALGQEPTRVRSSL